MAFVEDLAGFFDVAGFAVAALYNGATTVNGIFDAVYTEPLGNYVEGSGPIFQCPAADVPSIAQGDTFLINARTYKVRGVEPDGTGIVLLRLEEQ
jgi:hypothetical protein